MLAEAANAVTDTSSIIAALKRAAAATGSDFNYLLADRQARNPASKPM